jgi:hypothetical protein
LVGIAGFIPGLVHHPAGMPPIAVDSLYGRLLGLFPVNILHSVVHLLIGVWGLLASRSLGASRLYGKGLAIIFGLLTVLGLIPAANTLFGLVPLFGHDIWLHALTAVVSAYFGFVAPATEGGRVPASAT